MFVADGNFKADHVRQRNVDSDVWLSDGTGMVPNRQEYLDFLKTALERSTVLPLSPALVPMCTRRPDDPLNFTESTL